MWIYFCLRALIILLLTLKMQFVAAATYLGFISVIVVGATVTVCKPFFNRQLQLHITLIT